MPSVSTSEVSQPKFALFAGFSVGITLSSDPTAVREIVESRSASKDWASAGYTEGFPQFPQGVGSNYWTGPRGRFTARARA
jgi:hypothetical protein